MNKVQEIPQLESEIENRDHKLSILTTEIDIVKEKLKNYEKRIQDETLQNLGGKDTVKTLQGKIAVQ